MNNEERRLFRRLQHHLDRQPVGFPATWSRADIRFLERMFAPDEAEVALHLSFEPMALDAITSQPGFRFTREEARQLLESMFRKGTLGWRRKDGADYWHVLPMVIGMYESQGGVPTPEFLAVADAYMKTPGYGASLLAVDPPQMRTIPINQSIPLEHHVATYDRVHGLVEESSGPFVVLPCVCRWRKALEHEPCKKTTRLETCLGFGDTAAMMLRRECGREVTQGEALAILGQNQEDGLVLQPSNSQRAEFVCSCCGCCCGMLSMLKGLRRPVDFWTSNFFAEVDPGVCSHCGKCVSRCQVRAVALPRSRRLPARVNLSRCIGCGLCVPTCPSDAMRLKRKTVETVPPEDAACLLREIAARKKGLWARRRMLAKVVLGLRQ